MLWTELKVGRLLLVLTLLLSGAAGAGWVAVGPAGPAAAAQGQQLTWLRYWQPAPASWEVSCIALVPLRLVLLLLRRCPVP